MTDQRQATDAHTGFVLGMSEAARQHTLQATPRRPGAQVPQELLRLTRQARSLLSGFIPRIGELWHTTQ